MGNFILREIVNDQVSMPGEEGYFEWAGHRQRQADDGDVVGFFAAPQGELALTIKQRMTRVDNPRAARPSYQIAGDVTEPVIASGEWIDSYNQPGFAEKTRQRVSALIKRANLCEMAIDEWTLICLPVSLQVKKGWDGRLLYELSLDVSEDPSNQIQLTTDKKTSPSVLYDETDAAVEALLASESVADIADAELVGSVNESLDTIGDSRNNLANQLDYSDRRPAEQGFEQWSALASMFDDVANTSNLIINNTIEARADQVLDVLTVPNILRFESWQRTLRTSARFAKRRSLEAAVEVRARAKPNADRLYRPMAGETLYEIAWKFYGDQTMWHALADRNQLKTSEMNGTEILVIPTQRSA